MRRRPLDNDRGVALLIVLLVTALLVALVFEFAYATRVSLRAAVNFRDSQRAEFLARSGVSVAGRMLSDNLRNAKPRDNLEQREMIVPMVSGGDAELRVRWDDESGKINVGIDANNMAYLGRQPWSGWFRNLLENNGISQDVMDRIRDEKSNRIVLASELHQFMSDEEYAKVEPYITTFSGTAIDVNTAPEMVLKSVLAGKTTTPESIIMQRNSGPIVSLPTEINTSSYSTTSDYFKIYSHATVGEYTRQVEAVIKRNAAGFSILYWKAL